jgi:hypothetical protein
MTDFHNETEQVARKPHRCDFCETIIEKGERYSKAIGVFEGDFFTWKEHLDCRAALLEYMRLTGAYSYEPLSNMEDEDRAWIKQEYPTIFERRLKINPIVECDA